MLLIVEDEVSLAKYLEDNFRRDGYSVKSIAQIDEIETFILQEDHEAPQVIVLDRLLQNVDSSVYIPKFKKRFPSVKILVLSAIGGAQEKSRILDMGADDYVSKPFSIEEVGARIRVLTRNKTASAVSHILKLGNVTMHLLNQSVEVDATKMNLSRKEYLLLKVLMEQPTRVFNRYQLLDKVWDAKGDLETNVVEVTVKNLRQKLEDDKASVKVLSKRFAGYWIED
jgi:DNA-binding response OmpR family regulator